MWFNTITSSTSEINCGFKPDIIIFAFGRTISYPQLNIIDYINKTGVAVYMNQTNKNGGMNTNDSGYGFDYMTQFATRTETGFTYSVDLDANTTYPVYVWCIKVL